MLTHDRMASTNMTSSESVFLRRNEIAIAGRGRSAKSRLSNGNQWYGVLLDQRDTSSSLNRPKLGWMTGDR